MRRYEYGYGANSVEKNSSARLAVAIRAAMYLSIARADDGRIGPMINTWPCPNFD
jgi:hypothetical protein